MSSEPFISPNIFTGNRSINCLICTKVKINAVRWSNIKIPDEEEKKAYTHIYSKIVEIDTAFGIIHDKCRISFGATINRVEKKYGLRTEVEKDNPMNAFDVDASTSQHTTTRSKVIKPLTKRHCFICDGVRDVE